jgi:lysophospholipase L1-like esterase
MTRFPLHTGLTIAATGLLLAGTRLVMPAVRGPRPADFAAIVEVSPERAPVIPLVERPAAEPERPHIAPIAPGKPRLLEEPDGALDHFYQALRATEKRENHAVTRIVHYGDSPTTADLITGDVRRLLQESFGDAGHGFVLPAKPWAWYQHEDVTVSGTGWQMLPASRFEARDGMFGLGGVTFTGGATAHSRISLSGDSHVGLWFLIQPGGGTFTVSSGDAVLGTVDTAGDAKGPGFAEFAAPEGAEEIEIRVTRGSVRLFGVDTGREGPGVVYDSLGLNGASITVLSRMFQERHWAAELQHRNPDLVVINYGTNEADFAAFVDGPYEKELREAIRRVRGALPQTSIMVMSPMDRGRRAGPGEIETMPTIPRIVAIQRRVAADTGCGFFDTYTAMGGEGTMARWYAAQPRLVSADFIHPYPAGGRKIAEIFVRELHAGLDRSKLRGQVR